MIVLVSGSTASMGRIGNVPHLGIFFNPKSSNYAQQVVPDGMTWAADNAAFSGFRADKFLRMLDVLHQRSLPHCRFVAVPDVVGDASATLAMFRHWQPLVTRFGFPLAFVAQDGLLAHDAPWSLFNVLFIGGSTRWKLGIQAHTLCGYAKALGKGVHIGRVNSPMRAELFADVADSIDGTATSMYGDVFIPKMLEAAERGVVHGARTPQRELF